MDVAVLGSLNLDLVFTCEAPPRPGETILCTDYMVGPGGKGLNQAVAARRAGSEVIMLGAVGTDANGDLLIDFLGKEGVRTDRLVRTEAVATGLAHITVDRHGENSIIVYAGANKAGAALGPVINDTHASVFLAQLEVELSSIGPFFGRAKAIGARTILNAAPAVATASDIFGTVDILVVNEHELATFATTHLGHDKDGIARAARSILSRDDQVAIVTLGARGTQIVDTTRSVYIPVRSVAVTDTTGAGDCFCGVLAARLADGTSLPDAVGSANLAASIAVQRKGAAASMPTVAEIESV